MISESELETGFLEWLASNGYALADGQHIGPDGEQPERASNNVVVLARRLREALARLNPEQSPDLQEEAFRRLTSDEFPDLVRENQRLHQLLVEGVTIDATRPDGSMAGETLQVIDFENPANNDWLAVQQFPVVEGQYSRRPDVVLFLNGLPVVVFELKKPVDESKDSLLAAYNQLQTYKQEIRSLFRFNLALVISDGQFARIGSLTASRERFMPWRTDRKRDEVERLVELEPEVLIEGALQPPVLLELMRHFVAFGTSGGETIKILAGYHQFYAVQHAVERTLQATRSEGSRKAGVIWHTQGSGKSLLMAFYAGRIVKHPQMQNPTIVVLTDRNDLDDQLFATFTLCNELLRQEPKQAESRKELRELLNRSSGGVIFTTIQKFTPDEGETDFPVLTDRRNVVVIADEAHRSQYGFKKKMKADIQSQTMVESYGFAKYLRDALPHASFLGFTGTPIEADDVNTPAVFGDYVHVYDISDAVEDGATVPIYYESRLARLELKEDQKAIVDAEIEELTEGEEETEQEKRKREWSRLEAIVGTDSRLQKVAADMVQHFERRTKDVEGKAMIVCMSRRICVALYDEIKALRPAWHSDDENEGAIKVVITGSASDEEEIRHHVGPRPKQRRDLFAKRMKDPKDPLKLVIVCDMWLTGFDVPCLHTLYIDKPMKGHGLMQAIARVNRVYGDKPGGLVVDYIGIAQRLKAALSQYSSKDKGRTGIDEAQAQDVLQEKFEIVQALFHGFDYAPVLQSGTSATEKLRILAGAMDHILSMELKFIKATPDQLKEQVENEKKESRRKYGKLVQELTKAYALVSASDYAASIRDEIGFFQAVRTALEKELQTEGKKLSTEQYRERVQQIISQAVVSTDIIDILKATGFKTPNIGILSEQFLEEVRQMEHKNLAIEALRKLLNGEIREQGRRNVTQAKAFSERLAEAIARYHNNAVTSVEIIEELIDLAKEINEAQKRGEESGLSEEEIAFYDALAQNESAIEVMGNDDLIFIARELYEKLQKNTSTDWMYREQARAKLRVDVKRILRKYGYPPDLQKAAIRTVLQQAEVLAAELAVATA